MLFALLALSAIGQLRTMAASLAPLGSVYGGATSQGKRVKLYLAHYDAEAAVEYAIEWAAPCTDGHTLSSGTVGGFDVLNPQGNFGNGSSPGTYSETDPTTGEEHTVTASVSGQVTGDNVSGTWTVAVAGNVTCSSGPITSSAPREALLSGGSVCFGCARSSARRAVGRSCR